MKLAAIGRKNWLFVGSSQAGCGGAVLVLLIASCKANQVESPAWLRDVLPRLFQGRHPGQLLPDPCLTGHRQHRWNIVDRGKKEVDRSKEERCGKAEFLQFARGYYRLCGYRGLREKFPPPARVSNRM